MKLKTIEMELPDVMNKLYGELEEIFENDFFCIAGGCLSDIYMGKEFKDIDVFFQSPYRNDIVLEDFKKKFGEKNVEILWEQNEYTMANIPYLIKVNYMGTKVELIPSSAMHVTEFDIRFRQFFYYKKNLYVSEEALEDIKEKRIVVCNPKTPISTHFRMNRFKEQYGFEIDKKSIQYINWAFNLLKLNGERALNYAEQRKHKISKELFEEITNFYKEGIEEGQKQQKEEEKKEEKPIYAEEIKYIYVKENAEYPYHPETEETVGKTIREFMQPITVFHEFLETFEEFKAEELKIDLPFDAYGEKAEKAIKILKNKKLKLLLNNGVEEKEKVDEMVKILENEKYSLKEKVQKINKKFKKNIFDDWIYKIELKKEEVTSLMGFFGTRFYDGKIDVKFSYIEKDVDFLYADYITKSALDMIVTPSGVEKESEEYFELKYKLRKCENGKYTIAGCKKIFPEGSGFYLKAIVNELKKLDLDFMNLGDKKSIGMYPFNYGRVPYEFFFQNFYYSENIFNLKFSEGLYMKNPIDDTLL